MVIAFLRLPREVIDERLRLHKSIKQTGAANDF